MASLQFRHPDVYDEYMKGKFVVYKTRHRFSAIATDQAHEQNNGLAKGDGGAVGLTENPSALMRWIVSGPELARLITEFDKDVMQLPEELKTDHHEQRKGSQVSFLQEVKALVETIEEFGNPFLEESTDILVLDTRDIVDVDTVKTVRVVEKLGRDQYKAFVDQRLVSRDKSLYDPITRNQLVLFSTPTKRVVTKSQLQIAALKNDIGLFSKLYVACQVRDSNLDSFFEHENQAFQPSVSQHGLLRQGHKSDLLDCLPQHNMPITPSPTIDAMVVDGAAVVNMLKTRGATTFTEYAQHIFLPYILNMLNHVQRLDVVWDRYLPNSLKSSTRIKRGKGVRRRVSGDNKLPQNWPAFLRCSDNKTELFAFLAEAASQIPIDEGKNLFVTHGTNVLPNPPDSDVTTLAPCTHEEADTRIFLHVAAAVNTGFTKIGIRTVDTDVVVLAVSLAREFNLTELWVAFGTGKSFRYIAAHQISDILGKEKSKALPVFHSGCDTVSAFCGKGKKSAWDEWNVYGNVTKAFISLAVVPQVIPDETLTLLERFVIILYDRTSSLEKVDECRKELFTTKGRSIENIPPTKGALLQHIKRAAYQAGHVLGQALIPDPEMQCPSDWEWKRNNDAWEPVWSMLPDATKFCQELLKCGCKKGCQMHCKCKKSGLNCTLLCVCQGKCAK